MTEIMIEHNRYEITNLLRSTCREGIDRVIGYLEKSGFFYVPSSLHHHHNWDGGLADHSLGVYRHARAAHPELPHDSLIIACILHDLCKARRLYYDSYGHLHIRQLHIHGHGSRSIRLLEKLNFSLTYDEYLAIRWHMYGMHHKYGEPGELYNARMSPLWKAVREADKRSAHEGHAIKN